MNDPQRRAARALLDALSGYDEGASDETNEQAIGTAIGDPGDLAVDTVMAAAVALLVPLVDTLAEREDSDRHSVIAVVRQHVGL